MHPFYFRMGDFTCMNTWFLTPDSSPYLGSTKAHYLTSQSYPIKFLRSGNETGLHGIL